MFTEKKFTYCYVNGKPAGVGSYNGDPGALLLFFGNSLGKGDFDIVGRQNEIKAAGGSLSLHQFSNSWRIATPDLAGIQGVIPGAVVDWEGSTRYQARKEAAKGSRSVKREEVKENPVPAAAAAVPAVPVVTGDAFVIPEVSACPDLAGMIGMMPALSVPVSEWGAAVGRAVMGGEEIPGMPEEVKPATALVPALGAAMEIYKNMIIRAAREWKEKKEEEERKRIEKEKEIEAAKKAAESGKKLVKLPDGSTLEVSGRVHAQFVACAQRLKVGMHLYLHGPAGTGKTYLAKQLAESLGLKYFSDQKVANEYQLTGFVNAAGEFVETELYRAIKAGGLYLLDEIDASDTCAVTALNSALANGYITFAGVGRVEIPDTFRVVATGNTIGRGADVDYCGRNPLDLATLDRFQFVPVGYDPEIELQKAGGDKEIVKFIQAVREAAKNNGVSLLASYRAIDGIKKLDGLFSETEILESSLLKGLEKDQIRIIADNVSLGCRWSKALKELAA